MPLTDKTMDSTIIQDITKSVEGIMGYMSTANIIIPRVDKFKDIFDFIAEYELVTATLEDNQRRKLLIKAFPPGRLRAWFDKHLQPLLDNSSISWETIRHKIIDRYSDTQDRDRHFKRIQSLKFDPDGSMRLYDYVDDLLYSLSKAFTENQSEDTKLRFVRSNLPNSITPILSSINNYNATDIETFMKGIRQYDTQKASGSNYLDSKSEKIKPADFVAMVKDIVKSCHQEGEAKQVAAALRENSRGQSPSRDNFQRNSRREVSPSRPTFHMNRERSISPYDRRSHQSIPQAPRQSVESQPNYQQNYQNYNYPNYQQPSNNNYQYQNNRYPSINYNNSQPIQNNRPPSPRQQYQQSNYMQPSSSRQNYQQSNFSKEPLSQSNSTGKAFNDEHYFKKFGMPPRPCTMCQCLHWERHCPEHLN